ncbi:Sulredoxin [uncultured archaeon]|nr:Sulredoxin [uncultured archaeon]
MAFTKAAAKKDVPEGKGRKVSVNGKEIALFNVGGKFFATDAKCTHAGGPLANGTLKDFCVDCPWHHSIFDLRTGAVKQGPAAKPVAVYKTKMEKDDVLVDV